MKKKPVQNPYPSRNQNPYLTPPPSGPQPEPGPNWLAVALVAAAVLIFVATAVDGFVGNPVNAENPVGWAVFGVVFMMGLIGVMYWLGAEEGGR
jgi:hypothetical protein